MASHRPSPRPLVLLAAVVLAGAPQVLLLPRDAGAQTRAATGENVDAPDVYLQAFLYMQEAEKLEEAKQLTGAFYKFKDASDLFDSVARSFPSWNPQMVDYRRRKIRERLAQIREQQDIGAAADVAPLPPISPAGPASPNAVVRPPIPAVPTTRGSGSAVAQIQQRYANYEGRIQRLEADRADLKSKLEMKEAVLRDMSKQLFESKRAREVLRSKLVASEEALATATENEEVKTLRAQVAELQSELDKAITSMGDTNEKTAILLDELQKANATIAELRAQQEEVTKERDQLAALITAGENDPNSQAALTLENIRLKNQLEDAKESIATLTADNAESQKQAAMLREEVAGVRAELERIKAENAAYQTQVAELSERLKMTNDRLAAGPAMSAPEAVQENEALRAIILTQLKAQARRKMAKEFVINELGKLEADSTKLLAAIDAVAGPPVISSEEQRGLFRDPRFEDFLGGGGSNIHGTIIVPGNPLAGGGAPPFPSGSAELDPGTRPGNGGLQGELLRHASAGASAFARQDFQTAEAEYGEILSAEPQNVFAMEELAVVKLRLRKLPEAENLLQKAIAYNFENPTSHFLLGVTRFLQGDGGSAEESLRQSLEIDAANARARQYLGVIAVRRGDTKEAELEFREAISIDPGFVDAHFNLAVLYASSDEPALTLAREHYREAMHFGARPDPAMEKLLGI